jgi:hypothetical protein
MMGEKSNTHMYARMYHNAEVNHSLAINDFGCCSGKKKVQGPEVFTCARQEIASTSPQYSHKGGKSRLNLFCKDEIIPLDE